MITDTAKITKDNLSALENLLDVDNVKHIKKQIAELIIERVKSDIKECDYYLFCPGDYEDTIREAFKNVEKKIVKMYSDAALSSAQDAVQRFKDISVSMYEDTVGLKLRFCHDCKHKSGNKCTFYEDKKYYWIAHDTICAEEGFVNFMEKNE